MTLRLRCIGVSEACPLRCFHFCGDHYLRACDAEDLVPSDVVVDFQPQSVFGDRHDPVCEHGKVEMGLDSFIGLVVDRTYVEVCLKNVKGLFDHADYIVEFPYRQFVVLVHVGDEHILAVELLDLARFLCVSFPVHGHDFLILAGAFVFEGDGEVLADGAIFLVKAAETVVDGVASFCAALFLNAGSDVSESLLVSVDGLIIHRPFFESLGVAVHKKRVAVGAVDGHRSFLKAYLLMASVLMTYDSVAGCDKVCGARRQHRDIVKLVVNQPFHIFFGIKAGVHDHDAARLSVDMCGQ